MARLWGREHNSSIVTKASHHNYSSWVKHSQFLMMMYRRPICFLMWSTWAAKPGLLGHVPPTQNGNNIHCVLSGFYAINVVNICQCWYELRQCYFSWPGSYIVITANWVTRPITHRSSTRSVVAPLRFLVACDPRGCLHVCAVQLSVIWNMFVCPELTAIMVAGSGGSSSSDACDPLTHKSET